MYLNYDVVVIYLLMNLIKMDTISNPTFFMSSFLFIHFYLLNSIALIIQAQISLNRIDH